MFNYRVAVLRGSPSNEHDVSMLTGAAVIKSLQRQESYVQDIVITKKGEWLVQGKVRKPEEALEAIDVVFVALHGKYGEDGEVQRLIQRLKLPFTGSDSLSSATAFNKHFAKETLLKHGVLMPSHYLYKTDSDISVEEAVTEITSSFGPEYILKPRSDGSSIGIEFVRQGESLVEILDKMSKEYDDILVEEFIRGKEASVAILENYRGEETYAFPAIEIVTPSSCNFFTTDAKYQSETQEICPGRFSFSERSEISEISTLVHKTLGLSQYSRSDFIIKDRKPYFLEVNTHPGLTENSLYPKAAQAVGMTFDQLVAHLVTTASN